MKTATLLRVGYGTIAARWFGLLAMAGLLLGAVSLFAATTATTVDRVAGLGGPGYVDGETLGQAYFSTPCGLAVDITGEYLYVADRDNNVIRQLDLTYDETITVITNLISKPVGVALDAFGNVYVLNRGNGKNGTVLEFASLDSQVFYLVATNAMNLTNAAGLAVDVSGNIYVTVNSNTVLQITSPGVSNVVATVPYAGASLQGIVLKRSGPTAGLLAVCDAGRNGIYLINPNTGVITTNAGFHGAGDFSQSPYPSDVASASTAKFDQPMGVAEAGDGSLIVADNANHRVKLVRVTDGTVTNLYGVVSNDWAGPYLGFSCNNGGTFTGNGTVQIPDQPGGVSARMPNGVTIGPDGTVYTTEDYYHIIREVTKANITPPPPPPPAAPTGPIATAGYGQVFLGWTASSGATNYNVKRSATSGGETTIASIAGSPYTDTNVLDGTTYYYVVSALNTGGESPNSVEVSAMPLFSPAPTNLIVVTTNFNLISLAWARSAGATSYNIKRSTSTNAETTIASTASTSYNDTGVVNGETYYYVVSAVNPGGENPTNSNEVGATVPIPPPQPPAIGWFDYEGAVTPVTGFHPISGTPYVTHNDLLLAIETIDTTGPSTKFTDDGSNPSINNGSTPPPFVNGSPASYNSLPVTPVPDLIIKAVNINVGGSSAIVTAEFVYQVADPSVIGNNAALFSITNYTTGAQMYYTIDGSDPTNSGPGTSVGPISSGQSLSLSVVSSNLVFKIRGFKSNYQPSAIVTNVFSASNFVANAISFGTASGEPSSHFIARPGQFYYAPVTLEMLPGYGKMYSLQFNVTVTNGLVNTNTGVRPPAIVNGAGIDFFSMLMAQVTPAEGQYFPPADGNWYLPLPGLIPNVNGTQTNLVSSAFLNTNNNLLGVGWLYRTGIKYLATDTNGVIFLDFDTTKQDLIAYSIAHDTLFAEANSKIMVGAYSFQIPTTATNGDKYFIQLGSPSATRDGVGAPGAGIYIQSPPTNQAVTVGSPAYLVGDAAPFHWLNAGDFGDTNLDNSDVMQVYQSAILGVNMPPMNSDLYRAMDSCGNLGISNAATGYFTDGGPFLALFPVTNTMNFNSPLLITNDLVLGSLGSAALGSFIVTNITIIPITNFIVVTTNIVYTISSNGIPIPPSTMTNVVANHVTFYNNNFSILFDGNDTNINQIAFGDGVLDIADVYVTFRRSLDPSLLWFERYWTNGQFVAVETTNLAFNTNIPSGFVSKSGGKAAPALLQVNNNQPPSLSFTAGDALGSASQTVQIPITVNVFGNYPLRVLGLNVTVYPLDGSPALTQPVQFTPAAGLGQPTTPFSTVKGNSTYAAAWLDSTITGVSGNATIGTLTVTLPANTTSLSAYAVHFNVASGSPNGLAVFPKQTMTGLITLSSRNTSSYNDSIPDSWRLRWFGTIYDQLSLSNACPSGDGVNNWAKYVAGVDPNTPNDFPSLNTKTPVPSGATAAIHWPSVYGKQYAVLSSTSLFHGSWTTNAIVTGTGTDMEYDDSSAGAVKFYRVLILP